ncbi:hypothetical protein JCGZ_26629 [Jatropha curcas]|uniref:Uncharacterized protein n=1 Tax=Jatropha curcas TaxID=180498 RepID=A0A067JJ34_JATCU|nr:hypothetical protein JCGZ_26629 [Jatropha curcas]
MWDSPKVHSGLRSPQSPPLSGLSEDAEVCPTTGQRSKAWALIPSCNGPAWHDIVRFGPSARTVLFLGAKVGPIPPYTFAPKRPHTSRRSIHIYVHYLHPALNRCGICLGCTVALGRHN